MKMHFEAWRELSISISLMGYLIFYTLERSINFKDPRNLHNLSETELTILVANHLLGNLATSSCYLVDKNCTGKRGDKCVCEEDSCIMTGEYGDTSIGNDIAKYKHVV